MEYRLLGNTGLHLSNISLGASSLGGVFRDIDEKEAIRTVHTAIDNGINFIDVSPYYGFFKAETLLGKALKTIPRTKYYLSTKVGRYGTNGIKSWDYSAARAEQSLEESMQRLNVDFIDILHVHDIEFSDLNQVLNETIPALVRMKDKGKIGHVGITGLPLEKHRFVIEHLQNNAVEAILSFCHFCINDDSLVDSLPFFEKHKVGIINASPLSMGLLSSRGAPLWHPASERLKSLCNQAAKLCSDKGSQIEKLAVSFSVSNPVITTTLVSTASSENILKNIEWASTPVNYELLKEVRDVLKPVFRETWENS
jgi:aryl-alcohol dehydrogenase-like predicted oxidoreductase